jgi:hypothetical protein
MLRSNAWVTLVAGMLTLLTSHCANPLDTCTPSEVQLGFFSRGDCVLTRAQFFQGHEWLTWFGNRDLPENDRFTKSEVYAIADGNRRVDWPKELLIHLNNGVLAYANALTEFTDRPENQRYHFLLDHKNDSVTAAAESRALIVDLTKKAVVDWGTHRRRALTQIGKANHVLQDSFSQAHTVREPANPALPWCIRKVKAYIEREDGYDTGDIEYHGGGDGDTVGHTTTQDSIYRQGRDCHEPVSEDLVEFCLSETAKRARLATRDYLALVRRVIAASPVGDEIDSMVADEMATYSATHLELCP